MGEGVFACPAAEEDAEDLLSDTVNEAAATTAAEGGSGILIILIDCALMANGLQSPNYISDFLSFPCSLSLGSSFADYNYF